MEVKRIDLGETGLFSPFFMDFVNQKEPLKKFYSRFPRKENFKLQIQDKKKQFRNASRDVLTTALKRQYEGFSLSEKVKENLEILKEDSSFTITTGHQLNIFTGPLYFIYKIVTVINACKELKEEFPDYDFIPVYWMASEDHDFEEIRSIHLNGEKYTWESDQKGAVGRFDPGTLKSLLESIPGSNEIFHEAYLKHKTLASAVRYYVNELFGDEGLIVIDGDDRELKSQYIAETKKDLISQASNECVEETTKDLSELGYKSQVYSREINLFYLDDGIRERIVKNGKSFEVLNSDLKFSEDEILGLLEKEPEKFSPNVILRPLYQEIVLPNLAYVGGPSEVVYWLQLKGLFDKYGVPFPILLPRNFVLFLDHIAQRKMEKAGVGVDEIFDPPDVLIENHVRESSENELELKVEKESIHRLYEGILKKAREVDVTLEPMVNAETQKSINSLEKIEKKIIKAEKRHHDDHIRQIESLKEMLFPGGGPQERILNYMNFQLKDPDFIEKIKSSLSPFELKYHIIVDGS